MLFRSWDYVGGVQDVRDRVLRLIGDPEQRYREDPVRLLRAVRFAGKLGFDIHPQTQAPMRELAPLLASVPPARLFDETLKLFLAGHARNTLQVLEAHGLLEPLLPGLHRALHGDGSGRWRKFVDAGLAGGDARIAEDRPVTPTFLFATLLYPAIDALAQQRHPGLAHTSSAFGQALGEACDEIVAAQVKRIAIPKRFTLPLRELLVMQPKFERRDGRRMLALLNHPRFRAAYDLFQLRAEAGLADAELAKFWTEVQSAEQEQRQTMAEALGTTPASGRTESAAVETGGEAAGDESRAPARRRRRRRRPRGSGSPVDG